MDEGQIKGIVFAEIKTEKSTLSTRERQIREAVQSGKISWIEIRHHLNLSPEILSESDKDQIVENPVAEVKADLPSAEKKSASERLQSILKKWVAFPASCAARAVHAVHVTRCRDWTSPD